MPDNPLELALRHIRVLTEEIWEDVEEQTLADFQALGVGGSSFQKGTKWLPGRSDEQIAKAEQAWGFSFPPPIKSYLSILSVPDKPMKRFRFVGSELREISSVGVVYDWTITENSEVAHAYEDLFEGLCFDVEKNGFWPRSWGLRPKSEYDRRQSLGGRLDQAPRLMPSTGNRFLSTVPIAGVFPVFSINQTDMIVYARDIAELLKLELVGAKGALEYAPDVSKKDIYDAAVALPFWRDVLFQDD